MTVKKVPMRQCLALNESFPKHELFRIVRTPEGEVLDDLRIDYLLSIESESEIPDIFKLEQ